MRDLKFKGGMFFYSGFTISSSTGIGYEGDYEYVWQEWEAYSETCTFTEGSLEELLAIIDNQPKSNNP